MGSFIVSFVFAVSLEYGCLTELVVSNRKLLDFAGATSETAVVMCLIEI